MKCCNVCFLKKLLVKKNFFFISDYSQPPQYQDQQQKNYWPNQQQWSDQSNQYPPDPTRLDQQQNIEEQHTKVEVMRWVFWHWHVYSFSLVCLFTVVGFLNLLQYHLHQIIFWLTVFYNQIIWVAVVVVMFYSTDNGTDCDNR